MNTKQITELLETVSKLNIDIQESLSTIAIAIDIGDGYINSLKKNNDLIEDIAPESMSFLNQDLNQALFILDLIGDNLADIKRDSASLEWHSFSAQQRIAPIQMGLENYLQPQKRKA